jgi:hypothetical protein
MAKNKKIESSSGSGSGAEKVSDDNVTIPQEQEPGPEPDFAVTGQPEAPVLMDNDSIRSHNDLLAKALQDRAIKESQSRLNRIHEIEMQIKSQQAGRPEVPLKDDNGMTWEDYHDLFWQVKRGYKFKDDPFGLNRHLAHLLKEDNLVAWQEEEEVAQGGRKEVT